MLYLDRCLLKSEGEICLIYIQFPAKVKVIEKERSDRNI
jgi:hypothetical protein